MTAHITLSTWPSRGFRLAASLAILASLTAAASAQDKQPAPEIGRQHRRRQVGAGGMADDVQPFPVAAEPADDAWDAAISRLHQRTVGQPDQQS